MPTSFPDGLISRGVPLPQFDNGGGSPNANHYFVDGNNGSDGSFEGTTPTEPLRTMEEAFSRITSGDVIHVVGNIREQLNAPAGIFDVTIIGGGTRPRHADAHTGRNGYKATATWKAPASPTATTALLTLRQQGWRIQNMLFVPPTDDAAIDLIRDAASGDSERDSSHAEIVGCRFAGGSIGVKFSGTENVFNVLIQGNAFQDITTAISGGAYSHRAQILDNFFAVNTNHIVLAPTDALIARNFFGKFTTKSIDLTGGGGTNIITLNYLSGTYTIGGGYTTSGGTDEWGGNMNVIAGGWTAADPAA